MFGMGFMEIFLIAIVAIVALGPDKLPTAMVEVAKFIKKFKTGVADAKTTLDNELDITQMKEEANKFKAQLEDAKSMVDVDTKVDLGLDEIINDTNTSSLKDENKENNKEEKVSFKKKKKKKTEESTQTAEENTEPANKFKVNFDDDKKEENA